MTISFHISFFLLLYLAFAVFVEIISFYVTAKIRLPPFLKSLLPWILMKPSSAFVDSSDSETEEYSESETEDYLMGLGEEQRVRMIMISNF